MSEQLPHGWAKASVGDLRIVRGRRANVRSRPHDTFELWSVPSFATGMPEVRAGLDIGSDKQTVVPGTVLVCRINPRINRVWVVGPKGSHDQIASTEWVPIFPVDGVLPHFLRYYLQKQEFRDYLASNVSGVGGSLMRVRPEIVDRFPVMVPPTNEQRRIVAAIEEHLSRLDAAVAALERVRAELPRYRAAVLKAACQGRLVESEGELARRQGRSDEPARSSLGGNPRNGATPLYETPEGWQWTLLREVAELKGGITKGQKRKAGTTLREVPYLRVANVQRGYLDLGEVKTIQATEAEIAELTLQKGDVLFNEGGDRDKLGRGWVWNGELPVCIHQNHVFRARINDGLLDPRLVSWYGNSFGQDYFNSEGKQTTNLASINITKLGNLPIPIPPAPEQGRIVAEVDRRLSLADAAERTVSAGLAKAKRLRQAILKRAFEGKLVPQDPNDEPASVLLERIRRSRPA